MKIARGARGGKIYFWKFIEAWKMSAGARGSRRFNVRNES
jgi:hypothetical protein